MDGFQERSNDKKSSKAKGKGRRVEEDGEEHGNRQVMFALGDDDEERG